MKRIISFLFLLLFWSCGTTKLRPINVENIPAENTTVEENYSKEESDEELGTREEPINDTSVVSLKKSNIVFSDATRTMGILSFLASDELQGRDSGSEGIEKAAQFIEKNFKQNRLSPYFGTYRDTLGNFGKPAYNIVGWVEGSDSNLKDEFILIGAHYDHIGIIEPENGDAIANGANDNAAGTTMVMELARYFGNTRTNKRSLMFALFSAEEKGLLGSKHLAEKLKSRNLDLYLVLNYEMVGVPLVDKPYYTYASGFEKSNLGKICNTYAGMELVGFLPMAKKFNLFQRSDNYPFYQVFNVPAHTFSTFDFTNFEHYHKVSDEADQMDFEHMARLINYFIPVVEGIANASDKEIKYY